MKLRTLIAGAALTAMTGCGAMTNLNSIQPLISQQHPGLAMNEADCVEVGTALSIVTGLGSIAIPGVGAVATGMGALIGGIFAKSACGMYNAAVNGTPAVTSTTTTSTSSTAQTASK